MMLSHHSVKKECSCDAITLFYVNHPDSSGDADLFMRIGHTKYCIELLYKK